MSSIQIAGGTTEIVLPEFVVASRVQHSITAGQILSSTTIGSAGGPVITIAADAAPSKNFFYEKGEINIPVTVIRKQTDDDGNGITYIYYINEQGESVREKLAEKGIDIDNPPDTAIIDSNLYHKDRTRKPGQMSMVNECFQNKDKQLCRCYHRRDVTQGNQSPIGDFLGFKVTKRKVARV